MKCIKSLMFIVMCCAVILVLRIVTSLYANISEEELLYQALPDWHTFSVGKDEIAVDNFSVNISDAFKISAYVNTKQSSGIGVLFAKGHKVAGHYEMWIMDGKLAFYAPDMNNDAAVYTNYYIADGNDHKIDITYLDNKMKAYVDDEPVYESVVLGAVQDLSTSLCIGSLLDGTYEFEGRLKDIKIYKFNKEEPTRSEPVSDSVIYQGITGGKDFDLGNDSIVIDSFSANIGSNFTLTSVVKTTQSKGVSVLFSKGPKEAGHYELWLMDGKIAYYAPDMNNGVAVYTDAFIADGKYHHIALSYEGSIMCVFVDGALLNVMPVKGTVQSTVAEFSIGSLIDGTFEYIGYLADIRVYNEVLDSFRIREIIPDYVDVSEQQSYTPVKRVSTYEPTKYSPVRALKGKERLTYSQAIPLIDLSATAGYMGSIDKNGGNADWDWFIYQDDKNEWVLFEVYGSGCIYNFTQHRYPTSVEPTFNFYFDQSDTPSFSIKQSEFGKKAPFIKPVSDIYEGPIDNGRGPIWVVRSFIPMEFKTYCKVTSSVKLEGYDKAKGEGGWGHINYVLYDTSGNLETFDKNDNYSEIYNITNNLTFDPKYSKENESFVSRDVVVTATAPVDVLNFKGKGSIASVKLILEKENAIPTNVQDLRIRMYWDGHEKADVDAPIGTFFGNEYANASCDNTLLMLGTEIKTGIYFKGYNYFPMPFWQSARIEIYTVGGTNVKVSEVEIQITPSTVCNYDKSITGYFVSSDYYEITPNTYDKNTLIAEMSGVGHMVYGVLSGYDISSGCEGDVRVFFDGRKSPEIESDGSESWASYGWGFVTPPECNPFSGYNGLYGSNSYWSEVRLALGDSYFFKNSIRFELEHGGANEGMGSHSGQIFCYIIETDKLNDITDTVDMSDEESLNKHEYSISGKYEVLDVNSAYANGINISNKFSKKVHSNFTGSVSFKMKINIENNGVVLLRTSSQAYGHQAAKVYIDGIEVKEKVWYYADANPIYSWLDDSFQIPASYTKGKESIIVTIEPVSINRKNNTWNAASFSVLNIYGNVSNNEVEPLQNSKTSSIMKTISLIMLLVALPLLAFSIVFGVKKRGKTCER